MAPNDEPSDYGYDLAHEMKSIVLTPTVRRTVPRSIGRIGRIGREIDPGGDFGYDQAHEL